MSRPALERILHRTSTVTAACLVTLGLGLFFIFGRAPHPWGWEGFDHYHQLALTLARGEPFPTMEVPWGYAYFLAAFYRLVGDHPWVPLVVQAACNAGVPWLVFAFARTWLPRPTAVLAAVLAGVFSFNTVYASTQSSDALCTVIFMAALVAFSQAQLLGTWRWYAVVGLLTGIASQFRPNLILVPLIIGVYTLVAGRSRGALGRSALNGATIVLCAAAALAPWMVRNYRLTHMPLPTSVHGPVQLWYGTLQVGPYLHSRAYNPRSVFEGPVFEYTSLADLPILVSVHANGCTDRGPSAVSLEYWTDRDAERHRLQPASRQQNTVAFEIPATRMTAVLYYYFDATWPSDRGSFVQHTPIGGDRTPLVYFVSNDHLGDLDVHSDLLDIFDVVRLARHAAWDEPLRFEEQLAAAGIGASDVGQATAILTREVLGDAGGGATTDHDERQLRIRFDDGSTIIVPRAWSGRITDLSFDGPVALALMHAQVSLAAIGRPRLTPEQRCATVGDIEVNHVFYREEPHLMRRYSALAFDNIRREPLAFARAATYRAYRLFVIQGTEDPRTAQQFDGSRAVYAAATAVSIAYLALLIAGVLVAWRRGYAMALPLALIAYVPLTLSAVLTNMRYTITVQPLVFMFIAVALTAMCQRLGWLASQQAPATTAAAPDPAGR